MSYRSTIFVHFCYDEDVVKKISEIIMNESIMTSTWNTEFRDQCNNYAAFYSKDAGGAVFEYYNMAKEICKYLKTVDKVDVGVSMFIDGCGTISIEKLDNNFYYFDGNIIKDIDEAIEYLSQ